MYHVFSNGGFLFLSAVLLNQKRGAICKNLVGGEPKGIIVDSAPGDITSEMAARGFGAAAMKTHSDGFGDSFRLGVEAAKATFGAYLNLPPIKRRMQVCSRAQGSRVLCILWLSARPVRRVRRVERSEGAGVSARSCASDVVLGVAPLGLCRPCASAVEGDPPCFLRCLGV